MLAIYFLYYNFCRVHQTLRVTPAMEAGLSDHIWTIEEMVKLLDGRSILDGLTMVA
jgi:hypothetical protein